MRASLDGTKEKVGEMLAWLEGQGKVLIVVHDNPDPDCLASALAFRHLLESKTNRTSVIGFSGIIGRSENLAMARELGIPLVPLELINLEEFPVKCLLDTQPGTGNNSLPPGTKVDIVIDHHPPRKESARCRWVDIRPEYGVTATILYEYLVSQGVYIGIKLATALFYAIKSETQDLGREAGQSDKDAYLALFPLSNKKLLFEIIHPKLPAEYFRMMAQALQNAKIFGPVLIANLGLLSFPEVVAEMADLFLRLEGIDTTLCLGHYGGEVVFSIRTVRNDFPAGEVARSIISGRGVAGGHGCTAGGKFRVSGREDDSVSGAETLLGRRLLEAAGIRCESPLSLIPVNSPR